jgi:hypothetical protein
MVVVVVTEPRIQDLGPRQIAQIASKSRKSAIKIKIAHNFLMQLGRRQIGAVGSWKVSRKSAQTTQGKVRLIPQITCKNTIYSYKTIV